MTRTGYREIKSVTGRLPDNPGELVTRTGCRESKSVTGRLPDNPGELAEIAG